LIILILAANAAGFALKENLKADSFRAGPASIASGRAQTKRMRIMILKNRALKEKAHPHDPAASQDCCLQHVCGVRIAGADGLSEKPPVFRPRPETQYI